MPANGVDVDAGFGGVDVEIQPVEGVCSEQPKDSFAKEGVQWSGFRRGELKEYG